MATLKKLLPKSKTPAQLRKIPDDRWLAEMTKRVFCSGFVWRVIDAKWPHFEKAFKGFKPEAVARLPDEALEKLASNKDIVRNYKKIVSVRENAWFVLEIAREHNGFGRFIADWPEQNIVGLWQVLKKRGSRLGGHTGQYFLRFMGKDTFILSPDVLACLKHHGLIETVNPTSKRDLDIIQQCFNHWRQETGFSLAELSRIAACSVG